MSILITREFMYNEFEKMLQSLLNLPELENIVIKGVEVSSLEDKNAINQAFNNCYHDMYSDIDIEMKIKLNLDEYSRNSSIYADCLKRLGLDDEILGVSYYLTEVRGEVIRICKTNGMRFDLIIKAVCKEDIPILPHISISEGLRKANNFWFMAIQALGKLMRKDYLISSHLAHMLIQEGLVLQMNLRDKEKNTNFHRFGYGEDLEYLAILNDEEISFANSSDDTYNHIAMMLYSAVKSYDKLRTLSDNSYKSRIESYFSIWDCYTQERENSL